MRREVAQKLGGLGDLHARDGLAPLPDQADCLDDVVHVTLRVDAPWNGQSQKILPGRVLLARMRVQPEHHRADFDGAYAGLDI